MDSCTACHLPIHDTAKQSFDFKGSLAELQDSASGSCVRCSFALSCVKAFTTRNPMDLEGLQSIRSQVSGYELVLATGETLRLDVFTEHGTPIRGMSLARRMRIKLMST
jgi:hypothetical protein